MFHSWLSVQSMQGRVRMTRTSTMELQVEEGGGCGTFWHSASPCAGSLFIDRCSETLINWWTDSECPSMNSLSNHCPHPQWMIKWLSDCMSKRTRFQRTKGSYFWHSVIHKLEPTANPYGWHTLRFDGQSDRVLECHNDILALILSRGTLSMTLSRSMVNLIDGH